MRLAFLLSADAVGDGPKWQQVALEGDYKGYGGGELPFKLTKETFDAIVANFHAHPWFLAGSDGKGTSDVIPWDFHHASEYEATSGTIPATGAPAQGWVLDLETRTGTSGAELWALTRWLEPAKSYVKNGQYKSASVAVALNAIDGKTAKPIGPLLTSVALTNQPFIEGMTDLAAAKDAPTQERVRLDYYYSAGTPEEAQSSIRRCLGLPVTATAEEIRGQLETLASLLATGADMTGIDVDDIIGGIRTILGLPALTLAFDVMAQALLLFTPGAVTDDSATETETDPGDAAAAPAAATASRNPQERSTMSLSKLLASKLGVKETDDAIGNSVMSLLSIRTAFVSALGLDPDISDERLADRAAGIAKVAAQRVALLDAIKALVSAKLVADKADKRKLEASAASLTDQLMALFKAGGVENPDAAVQRISDTMAAAATLEQVMPELKSLQDINSARTEEEQTTDVAAACRTYFGGDESQKEVLQLFHATKGRKAFLEKYPAPGEGNEGLENPVLRTSTGAGAKTPAGGGRTIATAPRTAPTTRTDVVDLSMYPGANDTERSVNAFRATVKGAENMDYDTVFIAACEAKRTGKFVNLSAVR